jgi:hypothetical protein
VPGTTIIGSALGRRVGGSAGRRRPRVLAVPPRIARERVPTRSNADDVPTACGAGSGGRDALLRDPALKVQ